MTAVSFECLNSDRIFATTIIENTASSRVLDKCGMKKEGQLKNYLEAPSEKMIADGCSPERASYVFALTHEEKEALPRYSDILKSTTATSASAKR